MQVACLWSKWTARVSQTCFRSPPSRANRRLKWLRLGMTAASCTSSWRTSLVGCELKAVRPI